jgi:hypothetical protein
MVIVHVGPQTPNMRENGGGGAAREMKHGFFREVSCVSWFEMGYLFFKRWYDLPAASTDGAPVPHFQPNGGHDGRLVFCFNAPAEMVEDF